MTDYRNNIRAYEQGATDERDRIRRIMALPEAEGREGAALHVALAADMHVDAIRAILASVPPGPKNSFSVRVAVPKRARLQSQIPLEDIIDAVLR